MQSKIYKKLNLFSKKLPFCTMAALGNSFVIIQQQELSRDPCYGTVLSALKKDKDLKADQILFIKTSQSPKAKAHVVIYNKDGSAANMCANGVRCAAHWLSKQSPQLNIITLSTASGLYPCMIQDNQSSILGHAPHCPIGIALPVQKKLKLPRIGFHVNAGVPHLVFFVEDLTKYSIESIGSAFQKEELFQQGVNVSLVQKDGPYLVARVWERGVGETLSCGTAAWSIAWVGWYYEGMPQEFYIHFPGGEAFVRIVKMNEKPYAIELASSVCPLLEGVLS